MEPFTLDWVAEILSAQLLAPENAAEDERVTSISTDTRQIAPGALFFALIGENADGHAYVAQAFAKGAVAAVVSRPVENENGIGPQIVVEDTLQALGDLAAAYRRQFPIPVVGITGSVGKTTTKEMAAHLLRVKYNVLASDKNFNNEIGVPLTLFGLRHEHQVAVIEMGMRGLGEIDRLAEIAQPTVGVLTGIGYAHIERLGSQEAIAQAKTELLTHLPPGGFAILPFGDRFYEYMQLRVPTGVVGLSYGLGGEEVWPPDVRIYPLPPRRGSGAAEAIAMIHRREAFFALKAPGNHLLHNAGAALAVSHVLNIPLHDAAEALESWKGAPGRMTVHYTDSGLILLDDCYNAAPESMAAALETMALISIRGGVAVLGDMKELGDFAQQAHEQVGRKVVDARTRLLITVGELAQQIAMEAERYAREQGRTAPVWQHFASAEAAAAGVPGLVEARDTVLVKGSRAMGMEVIVAALQAAYGGTHG